MNHRPRRSPLRFVAAGCTVAAVLGHTAAQDAPHAAPHAARHAARRPSAADLLYVRSLPAPSATITDVTLNVNGVATDIGDIDVTVVAHPSNTYAIMDATFRMDPAHARLHRWITFHWVQAITADGCPAAYFGRRLPLPHLDPPVNGWDYMYLDSSARTLPDWTTYGWFLDDKPWYWNSTGEGANFVPGSTYATQDAPDHCRDGTATTFHTWLVAECAGQCFCLIRGFRWTIASTPALRAGPTDLGAPTAAHAATIAAALGNATFTGWSATAGCSHDYGLDAFVAVDPVARTIGFTLQVLGPATGLGAIFLASSVQTPVPTAFGSLYLDPASLALLAVLPLNAAGFGELRATVPAATYPDFAVQALATGAASSRLTNYALLGTYANATQTEILAARYDGARDALQVVCKGIPGDRIEVLLQHAATLPHSLGSFTVPPAPSMITFGHTEPGFRPGSTLEVWNRTRGARLIQMQ